MPNTPEPEATPESVDNTNPDSRKVAEQLDEAVALLAAEHLGEVDDA